MKNNGCEQELNIFLKKLDYIKETTKGLKSLQRLTGYHASVDETFRVAPILPVKLEGRIKIATPMRELSVWLHLTASRLVQCSTLNYQ